MNVKAAVATASAVLVLGTAGGVTAGLWGADGAPSAAERAATTPTPTTAAVDDLRSPEDGPASRDVVGPSDRTDADGVATDASAHDVLSAGRTEGPGSGSVDPIGGIDVTGLVPEGLDLTAMPDAPASPTPLHAGPGSLSAGPGCAYQCIASGIAYPRGFGAELVVTTKVEADLFMTVVADLDGDGDFEYHDYDYSAPRVTEHSWSLDHLEPGETYYAMVAATDEHGDTSHAFGEFTTLSTRTVHVVVDEVDVVGGPQNLESTGLFLRLDQADHEAYELGDWTEVADVERHVDVDLMVARFWEASVCEPFWESMMEVPQGDSDDSCLSWNTASDTIDLDRIPAGHASWTAVSFDATLQTPTGEGQALPPGYGDPRYFSLLADARIVVVYS
jgi:hypothetical protein